MCVFECMFAWSPLSGAEGSCGLIVRHTLGFDAFSVVVIHHLVRDFCQNTLRQCGWGRLETQRQTEREVTNTRTAPAVHDFRMTKFAVEPDAVKGPD